MSVVHVPLTRGKFAVIDLADLPLVAKYKWHASWDGYAWYARSSSVTGVTIRMHILLMDTPLGMHTDHRNGDGLDNRRSNLRVVTPSQNQMNRTRHKFRNRLGVVGVWLDNHGKYRARITVNRRTMSLGYYDTLEEATAARREAERLYFGEFAPAN